MPQKEKERKKKKGKRWKINSSKQRFESIHHQNNYGIQQNKTNSTSTLTSSPSSQQYKQGKHTHYASPPSPTDDTSEPSPLNPRTVNSKTHLPHHNKTNSSKTPIIKVLNQAPPPPKTRRYNKKHVKSSLLPKTICVDFFFRSPEEICWECGVGIGWMWFLVWMYVVGDGRVKVMDGTFKLSSEF